MKCPHCASENSDTQHFCGACGTPLNAASSAGSGEPDLTQTQKVPFVELKTGDIFAGRYQVIELLGAGGMGRVYRVLDRKLDIEVALKLVKYDVACDPSALARLRDEIKIARSIVHRNVTRMYDFSEEGGIPYITMEYVQGENLRRLIKKVGRLDAAQTVPIALQVCRGLSEAHRRDIVHRDLKPQNIMIGEDGAAQIMDFGLAHLAGSAGDAEKGHVVGTPAYISPEQIEGRAADRRSDLYSLGVVLYEMVTGRQPFRADSPGALALKHLTELPRDPREVHPDVPAALGRIIMRCLKKDPRDRYQSAAELMADFDRAGQELSTGHIPVPDDESGGGTTPPPPIRKWKRVIGAATAALAVAAAGYWLLFRPGPFRPSIAVLVESDPAAATELGHLPSGLQKNIIGKLSSIPRLRIVPWEAVSGYETGGRNTRRIGEELNAKYLLLLNIRTIDRAFRLTANLIDAKRGATVLSFNKDRPREEYFLLEDELPPQIARALKVHLVEERFRRIKAREPRNIDAFDRFLDGQAALFDADFAGAMALFQQAIDIEPNYALAYWGLGNAYEGRYNSRVSGGGGRPEDLERMDRAWEMAYDLSVNSPETNLGRGWAYFYKKDNVKAFEHFRRALEIDPGSVMVNQDVGAFLRSMGLYDRALRYLSKAARLNPLSHEPLTQMAQCQAYMGRFDQALELTEKAALKAPAEQHILRFLACQLIMIGRLDQAEKVIEGAAKWTPPGQRPSIVPALMAAARGEKEEALRLMGEPDRLTFEETWVFLLLGMKDKAIRNIEAGIEQGFAKRKMYFYSYPCLASNKLFRVLRGEPRFQDILKRQKEHYRLELKKLEKL